MSGQIKSVIFGSLCAALWVALFGCATMSVRTAYDSKVDFADYRIFAWVGVDRANPPSEWVDKLVRTAVEQELMAKGYQKANGTKADFLVAYDTALEERTVWQPVITGTGIVALQNVCRYTYREGTLTIDFIDSRSGQAIWRGCAIDMVSDRSDAERKIKPAVKQILERFPPKQ